MNTTCKLSETSLENANFSSELQRWYPTDKPIVISLPLQQAGWYSIDGQLQLESETQSLYLMADNGLRIMLPLTRKGLLLDVFYLPTGVKQLWLQLDGKQLSVVKCEINVLAIGSLKRVWRMLRRLALAYVQQPQAKRRFAKLRWYSLLQGLEPSYRKVSQLRAWSSEITYAQWQAANEYYSKAEQRNAERLLKSAADMVVLVYGDSNSAPSLWLNSLNSIYKQQWLAAQPSVLILTPDGFNVGQLELPKNAKNITPDGLQQLPPNTRLLLLRAGAVLAPQALAWWRLSPSNTVFSYSDHDFFTTERCQPQFKPDWSLELQRSTHYVGDVIALAAASLTASGWLDADWQQPGAGQSLVLRLTEQLKHDQQPEHIPAVLWHDTCLLAEPKAQYVTEHLTRQGVACQVKAGRNATLWLDYALTATPLVSIIIPTRDMLSLLAPCVNSVLEQTRYSAFEIIIVDNQSRCEATLAYMQQLTADPRVKVLRYDLPFNYAAINNYAVEQAAGEFICLLNNDTEVITPLWLTQMVAMLQQPNVGAVGARLLYSDRRVQHAGDAVGPGGCADHMHSRIAEHDPGYMNRAIAAQDLSAVTAACLLTPKKIFQQLAGLNAQQLAVAFNDVDYCLRIREAGLRVVYTPHAELYHHESVSRGKDNTDEKVKRSRAEADYMRQRWAGIMQHDPFYNPNLNYHRPDFTLGQEQRVKAPWQR